MKRFLGILMTLALVLGGAVIAEADLINGGFETGDFTGWTVQQGTENSNAFVVQSYDAEGYGGGSEPGGDFTFYPVEGSYFAKLVANGAVDGTSDDKDQYVTLRQDIAMGERDLLSGFAGFDDVAFYAGDYAWVKVFDGQGGLVDTPWDYTAPEGVYGHVDWTEWSFTADLPGTYTLELGIYNWLDSDDDCVALFDANLYTDVPEPGTMFLLGSGLIGLGAMGRRRFGKK